MALVDARGRGDVLKELDAGELALGLGEGQRDVDVHRLAVGALVALVAQAAELGDTALDGAGVLDVARGLAEAVGRAGRAVGEGGEVSDGGEGPERAGGCRPRSRAGPGRACRSGSPGQRGCQAGTGGRGRPAGWAGTRRLLAGGHSVQVADAGGEKVPGLHGAKAVPLSGERVKAGQAVH